MKRTIRTVTALTGSLLLMAAAAGTASASYDGLAGGAPGPADIWAASHPEFGKMTYARHATHAMHVHHRHTGRYTS